MKRFLTEVRVYHDGFQNLNPLVGIRYRDYLIIDAIEKLRGEGRLSTGEGFLLALRLRYNLHCSDKTGILPKFSQRKSYDEAVVFYSQPASIDYKTLQPLILDEA